VSFVTLDGVSHSYGDPGGALAVEELDETVTTRVKPMSVAFGGPVQAPSVEVLVETKFSPLQSVVPHVDDPSIRLYNLRLE
jgi:hypothetical protein